MGPSTLARGKLRGSEAAHDADEAPEQRSAERRGSTTQSATATAFAATSSDSAAQHIVTPSSASKPSTAQ